MTYHGVHEPIISAGVFRRVQDIKAGKYAQKVTRHNHLYRGLFRCGLCHAPMTPELQKGRVYYRCQTLPCATKTVREDRLEACITSALESLQITYDVAERMYLQWHPEELAAAEEAAQAALQLRIADEEQRLERLTDLLIDGTIDDDTFKERQRTVKVRIAELREQVTAERDVEQLARNRRKFLELMKNLVQLHENAEPDEKRFMVENCFSNRRVVGKNVELEPSNWLLIDENTLGVFSGALDRDTDRTVGNGIEPDQSTLTDFLKKFERYLSPSQNTLDGLGGKGGRPS